MPRRQSAVPRTPARSAARELVVGGDAIEHPDVVHQIFFVFVGIVRD